MVMAASAASATEPVTAFTTEPVTASATEKFTAFATESLTTTKKDPVKAYTTAETLAATEPRTVYPLQVITRQFNSISRDGQACLLNSILQHLLYSFLLATPVFGRDSHGRDKPSTEGATPPLHPTLE
jgi:hypothetical protein